MDITEGLCHKFNLTQSIKKNTFLKTLKTFKILLNLILTHPLKIIKVKNTQNLILLTKIKIQSNQFKPMFCYLVCILLLLWCVYFQCLGEIHLSATKWLWILNSNFCQNTILLTGSGSIIILSSKAEAWLREFWRRDNSSSSSSTLG